MLRLIALACLLAAVAAQPRYFCGTGPTIIRDSSFYLITRRSGDGDYPPGLTCEFNAMSSTSGFLVEIQTFRVSSATFTVSSSGRTLFSGYRIENYQKSITTATNSLIARFNASGDNSRKSGVEILVRELDWRGCPPGWSFLYENSNCFGTSATSGRLNFADAQKACNNMRSNLMQVPIAYQSSIGSFIRLLPSNLRSYYSWIGLTDKTSAGRFKHYWLNDNQQTHTSEISCVSGGRYSTCYLYERCGATITGNNVYAIFMGNCTDLYDFICSMPNGGTDVKYPVPEDSGITTVPSYTYTFNTNWITGWITTVPSYTYTFNTNWITGWITTVPSYNNTFNTYWIIGIVIGCMFVVGLVVGGIYTAVRSNNRSRESDGVAFFAGGVVVPPPPFTVSPGLQPQGPPPNRMYPVVQPYSTGPATPVDGSYGNAGYAK